MIPPEIIDRVRDATDIVQVVSQFVSLKKAGANYKGLCPFHGEKTPSFTVHQGKQIYHCFGCGEGGNVFHFLMKAGKRSFVEAVEELAEKAGIALPAQERDQEEVARKAKQREDLLELLELTASWFARTLRESPEAEAARAYVKKRGLDAATVERFRLGFSPENGQALLKAARQKGYEEKQLLEAGLLSQGERSSTPYSRFRGRLMFPIENAAGKVVGFGGRLLAEGEPKYLNSPETPVFSKGQLLFALPQAKEAIARQKQVMVVEGYMDALACHQAGLGFCVATLGTALGESHARQLRRYSEEVLLLFDSDRAGIQAALRGCEVLLGAGLQVKVVRLPGFKDPDEFLKAKGGEAFLAEVARAVEPPVFFLESGLGTGQPDLARKVAVAKSLFPLLAKYPTQMEADSYLRLASNRLGLAEEAVRRDFEAFCQGKEPKALDSFRPGVGGKKPGGQQAAETLKKAEKELLALMVEHPQLLAEAKAWNGETEFMDAQVQAALGLAWAHPEVPWLGLLDRLQGPEDAALSGALTALIGQPARFEREPEFILEDLLRKLKEKRLRYKQELVQGRLEDPQTASDPALLKELLAQKTELGREILSLKKPE